METPYLASLLDKISVQKRFLELLKVRVDLLNQSLAKAKPFEKNEAEISIIKTNAEIEAVQKIIAEKTKYFEDYSKHFEKRAAEMDRNYDMIMKSAIIRAKKSQVIDNLLKSVDKKVLEKDREARLYFFEKLRSLVNA